MFASMRGRKVRGRAPAALVGHRLRRSRAPDALVCHRLCREPRSCCCRFRQLRGCATHPGLLMPIFAPFAITSAQCCVLRRLLTRFPPAAQQVYTIYSILFIVFVILIIVTAFITVALTYFQLAAEDHRWCVAARPKARPCNAAQ